MRLAFLGTSLGVSVPTLQRSFESRQPLLEHLDACLGRGAVLQDRAAFQLLDLRDTTLQRGYLLPQRVQLLFGILVRALRLCGRAVPTKAGRQRGDAENRWQESTCAE
jgi:hypothetical protein